MMFNDTNSKANKMAGKLIVIDLDGATFEIIKPLIEKNRLPNFKKLINGGAHGILQSTIPAITPCAYSSFITGRLPGNTGIFDFVFQNQIEQKLETVDSRMVDGIPFWRIINHFGKKVGIINLPVTFPVSEVDGFIIGCGLTASTAHQKGFCHPPDLFDRSQINKSTYILKPEWKTMRYRSKKKYYKEVLEMFEARTNLTLELLQKEPWDFFLVHMHAIDWIQHSLWNDREKVHNIYEKVDHIIGKVMAFLDKDTNIMIMSDHGFGPTYKTLNLSNWLVRENYLKTKKISFEVLYNKLLRKIFGNNQNTVYSIFKKLYVWLPSRGKSSIDFSLTWLYENFPQIHALYSVDYMDRIDWNQTSAYTYGQIGAIYINIKNNQSKYEELRNSIIDKLYELKDESGEELVEKVYTKEELFSGNHKETAPDLLIYPKKVLYFHPDFDIKGVVSPPVRWRIGNHAREGIFIIYGNNIKNGQFIGPIDIVDVTPTMLYCMGLPILKTMDGKISERCFASSYMRDHKIEYIEEQMIIAEINEPFDKNDEKVREQLKGLGYI